MRELHVRPTCQSANSCERLLLFQKSAGSGLVLTQEHNLACEQYNDSPSKLRALSTVERGMMSHD
jgi:hypothetical protein